MMMISNTHAAVQLIINYLLTCKRVKAKSGFGVGFDIDIYHRLYRHISYSSQAIHY